MPTITIEAGKTHRQYLRDLWTYRELFFFLSWRDILVRYKQTIIGIAWSVLRPALTMIIFTVVFGKIAKLPNENVPYAILVFSAILPWQFFASTFQEGANSLLSNSSMISKVYFPRIIIPTTSMIVTLIDFLISFAILILLMIYYSFVPSWRIITLPLFLLLASIVSLGSAFWVSALNVKYRDFRYVVPFIVQFGLYVSPVGFTSNVIPEKWKLVYSLNPLVGVIDGFRWAILGSEAPVFTGAFIVSFGVAILIFCAGVVFFRKMEREFADVI